MTEASEQNSRSAGKTPIGTSDRATRVLVLATFLIAAALIAMSLLIANNLRETALRDAERDLARHSLTLAGQAERSFQSIDLILSNLNDHLEAQGVFDGASYRVAMNGEDTYRLLKGKLAGLPQLEAITMIDSDAKLINFSRYWPIPAVNVSDRDYFKALRDDASRKTFISRPVQNRGTGTWNIYVARRVNGTAGEFSGLILAAMSLDYFEDFYKSTSLGEGSAESLLRDDGTLLARYPKTSEIGKLVASSSTIALLQSGGGTVREVSPIDGVMRIKAVRKLAGVPLSIMTTQTEDSVLRSWKSTVKLLLGFTASMILALALATSVIIRTWRQQELLRRLNAEKAEAERAKALAETELLRQQERTAEAANRAKSNFLAVMSHEIRTPMNAVLGLTSTLLETNLSRDQRESVHAIHIAGDSLLEILNDILDFSKLEVGNLTLESVPFSPIGVIESAMSVVGASAAAKGLELRLDLDPDLPKGLLGDGGRIRQVLLNLASNAIKFTEAGEIRVQVEHLESDVNSAKIRWAVTDSGIGIPADRLGALFNDFVQADSSVSRRFGGSGLGLAICRRLVRQMGGDIFVESKVGHGSRFYFELSLPKAELPTDTKREDDTSAALLRQRIEKAGVPLRVLIVDDNQTNRLVATKMLSEFDVELRQAGDGREAVSAVLESDFDVVFMDMQMPEMDGLTATREIRAAGGKYLRVPIVAFTANAFADDREACKLAGMNDFVAKPVRKKFLVQAILRALSEREADALRHSVVEPSSESPADSTAAKTLFDRSAFEALVAEISLETAIHAFSIFVEDTRARLDAFSDMKIADDRNRVRLQAHTIKSTAGTFGFRQLSALAARLESSSPDIAEEEFRSLVPEMGEAFASAMVQFTSARKAA